MSDFIEDSYADLYSPVSFGSGAGLTGYAAVSGIAAAGSAIMGYAASSR